MPSITDDDALVAVKINNINIINSEKNIEVSIKNLLDKKKYLILFKS